jgi:hypothetical protein
MQIRTLTVERSLMASQWKITVLDDDDESGQLEQGGPAWTLTFERVFCKLKILNLYFDLIMHSHEVSYC